MRHTLELLGRQPLTLYAVLAAGLVLLVAAIWLRRRRRRGAGISALAGVLLIGISIIARWIASDTEDLRYLAGAELKAPPPTQDDWPQWRGPQRQGIARAPGLRVDWSSRPPEKVWQAALGGGYSSFAVQADWAVTMDYQPGRERVVALHAETGVPRATFVYDADYSGLRAGYGKGPRATPTIHDGRIYTVGATGRFLCLPLAEAAELQPLWQHDLLAEFDAPLPTWGVACSPLIEGDLVIVQPGGRRGSIVAFHRVTGEPIWASLDDEAGYSSPVAADIAGRRQVVAVTGSRLVGLSAQDGSLLWDYDFPTRYNGNIATPIVIGDMVFIAAAYGSGCALVKIIPTDSGFRAETVFRKKGIMRTHHMTAVLHEGHLYGCDDFRGDLTCLDLQRPSAPVWETRRPGKGSLVLAEGHLILLSESGHLWLIEATPAGYRPKGDLPVLTGSDCWAHPSLARGKLYLRDHEKAVCLKIAD